jgi:hypothetical protein
MSNNTGRSEGGPAFPQVQTLDESGFVSGLDVGEGGMTLRDYFAAKVISGFAAGEFSGTTSEAAEWAYKWADAMIRERSK